MPGKTLTKAEQDEITISAKDLVDALRKAVKTADLYSDNQAQSMFRVRGISHSVEMIGRALRDRDSAFNTTRFREDCGLTETGLMKKSFNG